MVLAAIMSTIIGLVVWFFLIPHPDQVGIYIEEMTEKEILLASATEKEVYENVIRNSMAAPEEVVEQVRMSNDFRRLSMQGS